MMSELDLPNNFAITIDEDDTEEQKVHIGIRQRGTRKHITVIEGLRLSSKIMKKLVTDLRKNLGCAVYEKDDTIECSGDQREEIKIFLILNGICTKKNIIMHGY